MNSYNLSSEVWINESHPGWHFVYVPKEAGEKIYKKFAKFHRGWTSLPIELRIGKSIWRTSMFKDKRAETYLFGIKSSVRKAEGIFKGDKINFKLKVLV